jgi:hypothetical protein
LFEIVTSDSELRVQFLQFPLLPVVPAETVSVVSLTSDVSITDSSVLLCLIPIFGLLTDCKPETISRSIAKWIGFGLKKNRVELGLDDAVPVLRLFVQHAAAQRDIAGIIYQDADAAKLALDPVKRGLQSGAIGHIHRHSNRWNTDGFQFGKHPLVLFVVSSKDCDGSPGLGQSERNARPIPPLPPVTTATRLVRSNSVDVFIRLPRQKTHEQD